MSLPRIPVRLLLMFAVFLPACSAPVDEERFIGAWRCDADVVFDAWRHGDALRLDFMGREYRLHLVESEASPHYVGDGIEAWQKDEQFFVLLDARRHECSRDETVMNAIERGVTYRAVGQEPGWLLEIFRGEKLALHYDYGGEIVELPYKPPVAGEGSQTYTINVDDRQLTVNIAIAPCHDAMSGQPYPDTVTVQYRDATLERELQGCGRPLPD